MEYKKEDCISNDLQAKSSPNINSISNSKKRIKNNKLNKTLIKNDSKIINELKKTVTNSKNVSAHIDLKLFIDNLEDLDIDPTKFR